MTNAISSVELASETGKTAVGSSRRPTQYLIWAICIFVVVVMAWPLLMSFLTSVKTPAGTLAVPPEYLPKELSIQNYIELYFFHSGLMSYLTNSLVTALLTIVLCLLLAVPAGYGLARFDLPYKEVLFLLLLASMMLPYQAMLVPLFKILSQLKLSNSHLGLAIVHTILQLPFSIYLMRNSFEKIPREMDEAAVVDGCTSFDVFFRIYLPLSLPGIVTVTLFAFIMSWNEFLAALVVMNDEASFTIPILLTLVRLGRYGAVEWGPLQAGVVISIIPCLLIYLLLQRYYVSGFLSGAVK